MHTHEYDLQEAISHHTGGRYRVNVIDNLWASLQERLRKEKISAYEFCHFFVHKESKWGSAGLLIKNFVTSPGVWENFLLYKKNLVEDIRGRVLIQRENLHSHRNSGRSLEDVLLDNSIPAVSIVRVEEALHARETEDFAATTVLSKYTEAAVELARGCPEYLLFAPYFEEINSQNEPTR